MDRTKKCKTFFRKGKVKIMEKEEREITMTFDKEFAKCLANTEYGEGVLVVNNEFYELNTLMKLDLLKDWHEALGMMYDENFEIWKKEMEDIRPNHFKDSDGHHNQIRESFSASSQFKCEGCNG